MNSELYLRQGQYAEWLNEVSIPKYTKDESDCMTNIVEFTRHIQELEQLYKVYSFQLNNMLDHYTLKVSDKIERKINTDNVDVDYDYVAINALTTSYISSGKTLIDAIETFVKHDIYINEESKFNEFKENNLKKEYDNCFAYRLLLRLRDFAQHGHLPISIDENSKAFINLDHYLNVPHFNHNANIRQEAEIIKEIVYEKYGDSPHIIFTKSIAEFNLCMLRMYLATLHLCIIPLNELEEKLNKIIENKPDAVTIVKGVSFVFCCDSDRPEELHAIDWSVSPSTYLETQIESIISSLAQENENFRVFSRLDP